MTPKDDSVIPGICLLMIILLILSFIAYENLRAAPSTKQVELKDTVQEELQKLPIHSLGPLVFLEAYNFHDNEMSYKVIRLETGERVFIAYSSNGISCIKIDKR